MFQNFVAAIRDTLTAPAANDSRPLTCVPHNLDPALVTATDNVNALILEAENPWSITWEQIYEAIANTRATH